MWLIQIKPQQCPVYRTITRTEHMRRSSVWSLEATVRLRLATRIQNFAPHFRVHLFFAPLFSFVCTRRSFASDQRQQHHPGLRHRDFLFANGIFPSYARRLLIVRPSQPCLSRLLILPLPEHTTSCLQPLKLAWYHRSRSNTSIWYLCPVYSLLQ